MNIKFPFMCRGEGKAYILTQFYSNEEFIKIEVLSNIQISHLNPVEIYHLYNNDYVVVVPWMNVRQFKLEFLAIDEYGKTVDRGYRTISLNTVKWLSRLNYRTEFDQCMRIRDIDKKLNSNKATIDLLHVIPDNDRVLLRFEITTPHFNDSDLNIDYFDACGNKLNIAPFALADNIVEGYGIETNRRILIFSIWLPEKDPELYVHAYDGNNNFQSGFGIFDIDSISNFKQFWEKWSLEADSDPRYPSWLSKHKAGDTALVKQREVTFNNNLLFSIVVPLFNTPKKYLVEMIESVLKQSYINWELILINASPNNQGLIQILTYYGDPRIKVITLDGNKGISENTNYGIRHAKGEFICFLDHDDCLAPDALFEYSFAINKYPDIDLLYCDEDKFNDAGEYMAPFFKPDYSPELLRAYNYITHFLAVRRAIISQIGEMNSLYDGAQDYDMTLRVTEVARRVFHVRKILYHWRTHPGSTNMNPDSKSYAQVAGLKAVSSHCERMGIQADVLETEGLKYLYRVKHNLQNYPKVSIIIPNKDNHLLLKQCIESIVQKSTYTNYEIVVVENNSIRPETFNCYEKLTSSLDSFRVINFDGPFNFSKIVNFGVRSTNGDYVLLLNNDTEVITKDFIEVMLGYFQSKDVGVVGAKLLFKDKTVQHAGVTIALPSDVVIAPPAAVHPFQFFPSSSLGYFCRAILPQNYSAVTGACQMIPRSAFDNVGGYNEDFSVAYNDVDFCLRLRAAGYYVVFTPYAQLFHYELATRGKDTTKEKLTRLTKEQALMHYLWSKYYVDGDPYLNPAFSSKNSNMTLDI